MIFVSFDGSDMNTKGTCSGQEGSTACRWDYEVVLGVVERAAVVDKLDWFGAKRVLDVRLSCAFLMEQVQKGDQTIT